MIYPMDYTTFEKLERQIRSSVDETEAVNDYTLMAQYIRAASVFVSSERVTNRVFVPYDHTHEIEYTPHNLTADRRFLYLSDDCLAISAFKNTDSTTISSSLYRFRYQYDQVHELLELPTNLSVGSYTGNFKPRFEVTGTWGYQPNYSNAWVSTTTLNGAITDSDTTITVNSVSNLERLHYLKIDSEYMQITGAIPAGSPLDLTVLRGVNGSTASSHSDSDTVSYWTVEPSLEFAVTRIASSMYRTRHNAGSQMRFADGTVVIDGDEKMPIKIASYLMKRNRIRGV